MSTPTTSMSQQENRTKAALWSFVFHAALFAVLFFYKFSGNVPEAEPVILLEFEAPPLDMGGGGDNAAAGLPDQGQGNDRAPLGSPADPGGAQAQPSPPAPEPSPTPSRTRPSASPVPTNTPVTDDPSVAALRRQQEEQRRRDQAVAEANRRAEQERQAAAEAERRRQEENKKKFGGAFGGGTGSGSGNTGRPGNQGVPGGTGDNPFGKSPGTGGGTGGGSGTGSGEGIGGGLRGRGVVTRPRPDCQGSGQGKVIVEVTVNSSGQVTAARATQKGSTLNDATSRSCAERTARRFVFAPAQAASQSGTIQVNFGYTGGN